MATITINAGPRFPVGTLVGAYPKSNWLFSELPPTGAAKGAATATGTVAADGSLTITGLADGTAYFLGKADGSLGYITAITPAPAASSVSFSGALPAGTNLIGGVKLIDTAGTNAVAVSAAGRLSVDASGVAVPITDNAGSLTVDGSVSLAAALPAGTNSIGAVTMAAGAGRTITKVLINTAASGDTALAAAAGGSLKHKVFAYYFEAAGAVNVALRSATTSISGLHRLLSAGDGKGAVSSVESPIMETAANVALNINLSAAVQVDGWIAFVTEA